MKMLEICDHLEMLIGDMAGETTQDQWEWGMVPPKTDGEHVEDFRVSLQKTREYFGLEGPMPLHGCYVKGTDHPLCHTGTHPGGAKRARFIASADPTLIRLLIAYVREKESVTA